MKTDHKTLINLSQLSDQAFLECKRVIDVSLLDALFRSKGASQACLDECIKYDDMKKKDLAFIDRISEHHSLVSQLVESVLSLSIKFTD